ncbi:MAG: dockerin type I repeat-containing protein, partial [Myxococcales bacterium]|nr:dockerin type I repeat-containing protein [Myxococcales bacterium]
ETISTLDRGLWELGVRVGDRLVASIPDVVLLAAGDVDRDGSFDSGDLVLMMQEGKYETGEPATADQGDVNGDGLFDSSDLVVMMTGSKGVTYDGPAYVEKAEVRDPRQEENGKWVVGDYFCWLAAKGPRQTKYHEKPSNPQIPPGKTPLDFTYNVLDVDRSCSALAHDPSDVTPVDMAFPDPANTSLLHARCNYGGAIVDDVNDDLSAVGESYSPGHATIHGELNHKRDVTMYCEPRYFFAYDDQWVKSESGSYILTAPRMTEKESCRITVDVEAEGMARAFASGSMQDRYYAAGKTFVNVPVAVPAESETKLRVQFPAVSQLTMGHERAGADLSPEPYVLSGIAKAFSPEENACTPQLIDDVKCEVGVQLGEGPLGLGPKVECFAEISGKSLVNSVMGCASADDAPALATMYVARSKQTVNDETTYDGPIRTTKDFHFVPVLLGPYRKAIGEIGINVDHRAKSNSTSVPHWPGDDPTVHASEATSIAEGVVRVRLSLFDPPDPPDGLSQEEEAAYWAENYPHCALANPPGPADLDFQPFASETVDQGEVVLQRGRSVSVGTNSFDWRYYIERNTGDAYPLFLKK